MDGEIWPDERIAWTIIWVFAALLCFTAGWWSNFLDHDFRVSEKVWGGAGGLRASTRSPFAPGVWGSRVPSCAG